MSFVALALKNLWKNSTDHSIYNVCKKTLEKQRGVQSAFDKFSSQTKATNNDKDKPDSRLGLFIAKLCAVNTVLMVVVPVNIGKTRLKFPTHKKRGNFER